MRWCLGLESSPREYRARCFRVDWIGAHRKIEDNAAIIMPLVASDLKSRGRRGAGAKVEVEVLILDRAMLA